MNSSLALEYITLQAIITFVERVTKALAIGKYIVGVFFDLKKAFDTVDHIILQNKLEKYGIRGKILNWFKSYQSCSEQFVEFFYVDMRHWHMQIYYMKVININTINNYLQSG